MQQRQTGRGQPMLDHSKDAEAIEAAVKHVCAHNRRAPRQPPTWAHDRRACTTRGNQFYARHGQQCALTGVAAKCGVRARSHGKEEQSMHLQKGTLAGCFFFCTASHGCVVRVKVTTGMADSGVGGQEHRGTGSATGIVGCDLSAAAAGAEAPKSEPAACRPVAITVGARVPAAGPAS